MQVESIDHSIMYIFAVALEDGTCITKNLILSQDLIKKHNKVVEIN